ncbi:MAG: hypothetical protein D5R98_09010 [Desulfonatronovibrio sp. MSAO_Bac4]|nr:MAG: hypothetical protein D5R98_09010 [Desulfonatronovibrio sp. MSAO_Bac4]
MSFLVYAKRGKSGTHLGSVFNKYPKNWHFKWVPEGASIPLWRTLENSLPEAGQRKKYEQQFHTKRRRTNFFNVFKNSRDKYEATGFQRSEFTDPQLSVS